MVTTPAFHQQFTAAMEAWKDSADASARFATAVAALTPLLRVESEVEGEELIAAIRIVAVSNQHSSTAMWSVLQRLALHDPALTDALLELIRRQIER